VTPSHHDALRHAGQLLGRREHARAELERKLARRTDAATARRAAQELVDAGLLDDQRFAERLASHRLEQGWGPARITLDLARAGVDPATVRDVIAHLDPAAVSSAARRAVGTRSAETVTRRLLQRGFAASGELADS
jgi:regulatory protein